MQEVSEEVLMDIYVEHIEVLAGSNLMKSRLFATSTIVDGGLPTTNEQEVVSMQRQEVHPRKKYPACSRFVGASPRV